jgi:hypothetical protein
VQEEEHEQRPFRGRGHRARIVRRSHDRLL